MKLPSISLMRGLVLGLITGSLFLTACEETGTEPLASAVDGTSFFIQATSDEYERCLRENPNADQTGACDSLEKELDELNTTSEILSEAFRGVDPKPLPIPDPPQPCPQGQCLELFDKITALIFPATVGVKQVRLVAEQKVLSSASLDNPLQVSTILDGTFQVFTLAAAEIPQDVAVSLEIETETGAITQELSK